MIFLNALNVVLTGLLSGMYAKQAKDKWLPFTREFSPGGKSAVVLAVLWGFNCLLNIAGLITRLG